MAGGHASTAEIVVVAACHARHSIAVALERKRKIDVTCHLIEATDSRITELSTLYIVHKCPINVDFIILLIECPIPKSNGREQESHLTCIGIGGRIEDSHVLRHVIIFAQLGLGEGESVLFERLTLLLWLHILGNGGRRTTESYHC